MKVKTKTPIIIVSSVVLLKILVHVIGHIDPKELHPEWDLWKYLIGVVFALGGLLTIGVLIYNYHKGEANKQNY